MAMEDDSSSSSQNWLSFSLNNPYPPCSDSSLYLPFTSSAAATLDLSMFNSVSGGPKLENLLGGGRRSGHLEGEQEPRKGNNGVVYESDLKSIASSFLRGYSSSVVTDKSGGIGGDTCVKSVESSKKAVDTFGQRTSIYRGVTRHRWTGRYEAHLWDNSCRREGQSRKGRQVYLGGYDKEEKAARAYDLAALKYWGPTTTTNFPVSNYETQLEEMKNMTRQEFVASLRRKSSGFSRGASIYRGVTRHHQHGRWQARIGRVAGNKDLYLGTFSTQEEAAEAYDIAAIKFRGLNAVTNFDMSRYDVKSIASSSLPIGGITSKPKASSESISDGRGTDDLQYQDITTYPSSSTTTLSFGLPIKQDSTDYWSLLGYQNPAPARRNMPTANTNLFQNGPTLMDYSTSSDQREVLNCGDGYVQQQQQQQEEETSTTSPSVPFATPISLSSSNTSYEVSTSYGRWVTPFQNGKPNNMSVYQTPIYGME